MGRMEDKWNPLSPRPLLEHTVHVRSGDRVKGVDMGGGLLRASLWEPRGPGACLVAGLRAPVPRFAGQGDRWAEGDARLGQGPSKASAVLELQPLWSPTETSGTELRSRTCSPRLITDSSQRPQRCSAGSPQHQPPHPGALDTAPAGPCWSSGSTGPCPLQWTLIAGWDLETRRIWRRKYRGQLIEIWVVLWAYLCPPNLYVEVQTQNRAVFGERAFAWVIEVWRGPVDGS